MKKFGIVLSLAVGLALLPTALCADSINFGGGNIVITPISANQVGITFESNVGAPPVTIVNQIGNVSSTDLLNGTPVFLTPNDATNSFVLTSGGSFLNGSNSGTLSLNGGAAGAVNADVSFISVVTGGTGGFTINLGLSNVGGTPGTSALLNNFLAGPNGIGVLTFQFDGIDSLSGLFANQDPTTTVSGSVTAPEPGTLALLGAGLLCLGGLLRRRYALGA